VNSNREELLLRRAPGKPAPTRAAWLDAECEANAALHEPLEQLLTARAQPEDKVPTHATRTATTLIRESRDDSIGVDPEPGQARTKNRAEAWEIVGCAIVLAFLGGAGGLWAWTFIEFLRLLVEMMPQPQL
jgi:hypothetical protein